MKKDIVITFKVSAMERRHLKLLAEREGFKSVSAYIRHRVGL